MTPDLQAFEATLKALRPATLDSGLAARLGDAVGGTLTNPSASDAAIELALRQLQPVAPSAALAASLEDILTTPAAPAAKIVAFPRRGAPRLAAAAAVAMLGVATALWFPGKAPVRSAATPVAPPLASAQQPRASQSRAASDFIPAAFNTGLSQASDEGVIWQPQSQPKRVVKVVYWERVTLVNPEGKTIECEQPRVKYILVPEKID